jgi:hypothetical protein
MASIENDDPSSSPPVSHITCPQCSGEASFDPMAEGVVQDETFVSIPLTCQQCGHKWLVNLQKPAAGSTSASEHRALIELSAEKVPDSDAKQLLSPPDIQVISPGQGVFKDAPLVAIPRLIFWGMSALIILLVGLGGWLFGELQRRETEDRARAEQQAALVVVRATGTAEQRMTATQQVADRNATATSEARANIAASATMAWAETSMAATATAEWKATSTAEMVATISAEATATAERIGTATAERRATDSIRATATAQWQATSTAEARATPTPFPTPTPGPKLNLEINACDTGYDASRGLAEVKNAWVTVQNVGDGEASDVTVTLSANDENKLHPDKSVSLKHLPPGYQVSFKLTVDTTLGTASTVKAVVTSRQGMSAEAIKGGCTVLDENAKKVIERLGELGKLIRLSGLP